MTGPVRPFDGPISGVIRIEEPDFQYCAAHAIGVARHTVARGWSMRAVRCGTAVEKAVPDPSAEIFVSLGPFGRHLVGPERSSASFTPRAAWVVGPHAASIFLAKEVAACDVVAVRILPGKIRGVLGVSAVEISGRLIDLEAFWGRGAVEELRERLFQEADPLARVRVLENDIVRRSHASCEENSRTRQLCSVIDRVPNPSVGDVARCFGLSHRKVIALFDEHIGLKPKVYQRVRRLWRVLERVSAGRAPSWTGLAYEAGYADQAHLVNEFRDLTGISPTHYVQKTSPVGLGVVAHVRRNGAVRQESTSRP